MTYELAKKLKDAGFPLIKWWAELPHEQPHIKKIEGGRAYLLIDGTEGWLLPTLEELIEACGDNFISLDKGDRPTFWGVCGKYFCCVAHGEGRKFEYSSTPLEAVANLWLTLNKK